MKDKMVIAIIAVGLLTVLVAATGMVPASAVILNGSPPPVASKINYQGQLRDGAGNPLDGSYDMEFLFYDAVTGGSQVGSTITKNDVLVDDGLFSVKLDVDQDAFCGQELWLEVRVGGEILSPRQEILPVPYALSLRPGADILGTLTRPILFASNDGAGDTAAGLWGTSVNSAGVYGQSTEGIGVSGVGGDHSTGTQGFNSGSGIGVRGYSLTGTAISAAGTGRIESTADSYIFVPGYDFVRNVNTDSTRWDCQGNGSALIWRGATTGNKFIYIPITVPAVLYGQDVFVEDITVYYKCQNGTQNYIGNTCLWKQTDADSYVELLTDYTLRQSNTVTSYTLTPTAHEELASNQGILSIHIRLDFVDDTNYIQLGGVRLRLGHWDPGA